MSACVGECAQVRMSVRECELVCVYVSVYEPECMSA